MMDAPEFMHDTSRSSNSPPLHRPTMAPQYGLHNSLGAGPITTMPGPQSIPAPHFPPHNAYSYSTYSSSLARPLASMFKTDPVSNRHHEMEEFVPRGAPGRQNPKMFNDYVSRTSPVGSRPASTVKSADTSSTSTTKCITLNETLNPADQVQFDTQVDKLMKVIQNSNKRSGGQSSTPAHTPNSEGMGEAPSPASPESVSSANGEHDLRKKYVCDGPNCNKRFSQKTHLQIHRRTHSGEKPFKCDYEGCGLTFSQRGNLRTHLRRHTGEKPFKCKICNKEFAQKGNVRSHEETHKGMKPFTCRLDNCNKTFSQLGNMKTHQNAYHAAALERLTDLFIEYANAEIIPEEHRDLFDYFKEHYKNSNKGIKGRGKHRTVATKTKDDPKSPISAASMSRYRPERRSAYAPAAPIPRSHQSTTYPFYGVVQEHQGPPAHMMYEEDHSRQMGLY